MPDREKVIRGLDLCQQGFACPSECPYLMDCNDLMKPMFVELAKDALALLKQEAVEPLFNKIMKHFVCPNCSLVLDEGRDDYCPSCGKRIAWDEYFIHENETEGR